MSVQFSLQNYFNTQWGTRTKVVFPNVSSELLSGAYTDADTTLEFYILMINSEALGLPVVPGRERIEEYLLQINIMTPKNIGELKARGHVDQLDSIFRNNTFVQDSITFNFRSSIVRPPLPDDLVYNLPWEASFFVYV